MRYFLFLIILCLFNCGNERVLQLPEIENAEISEVLDISPAYIFYDDTQPDSTFLNRKNLISTTNWLVNVDKRLTLKQAIPHIKFLQDKKRNAKMHKNEDAKNYFTCNDTSLGSLGFVEFTEVNFISDETPNSLYKKISVLHDDRTFIQPEIKEDNKIHVFYANGLELKLEVVLFSNFAEYLEFIQKNNSKDFLFVSLIFKQSLSFQDYISIKSELIKLESDKIIIDTNEFIY